MQSNLNFIIEENSFENHNLDKFSEELKIHCNQNLYESLNITLTLFLGTKEVGKIFVKK